MRQNKQEALGCGSTELCFIFSKFVSLYLNCSVEDQLYCKYQLRGGSASAEDVLPSGFDGGARVVDVLIEEKPHEGPSHRPHERAVEHEAFEIAAGWRQTGGPYNLIQFPDTLIRIIMLPAGCPLTAGQDHVSPLTQAPSTLRTAPGPMPHLGTTVAASSPAVAG